VLSAIIVVGPEIRGQWNGRLMPGPGPAQVSLAPTRFQPGTSLVCTEVLGRSVLERLIEDLRRTGVDVISVFGDVAVGRAYEKSGSKLKIETCSTEEAWRQATKELVSNRENGCDVSLVLRLGAYVDLDLDDALLFHREQAQGITRAFEFANELEKEEPLDIWITDSARVTDGCMTDGEDLLSTLRAAEPARYIVREYVNRLGSPRDLRQLVVDGLTSRCNLRPKVSEIRPGVWMDEGAQVDRGARIVAPAYIGRGARIAEQCLITRCSNIESNCQVDYGTVVEDSSILSNTYVGVGLDISHSIVDGNSLLNLDCGVAMEISDSCVIRRNGNPRQVRDSQSEGATGIGSLQFLRAEESTP
jgi:NDP-sugar pyrophosphorylase family protein